MQRVDRRQTTQATRTAPGELPPLIDARFSYASKRSRMSITKSLTSVVENTIDYSTWLKECTQYHIAFEKPRYRFRQHPEVPRVRQLDRTRSFEILKTPPALRSVETPKIRPLEPISKSRKQYFPVAATPAIKLKSTTSTTIPSSQNTSQQTRNHTTQIPKRYTRAEPHMRRAQRPDRHPSSPPRSSLLIQPDELMTALAQNIVLASPCPSTLASVCETPACNYKWQPSLGVTEMPRRRGFTNPTRPKPFTRISVDSPPDGEDTRRTRSEDSKIPLKDFVTPAFLIRGMQFVGKTNAEKRLGSDDGRTVNGHAVSGPASAPATPRLRKRWSWSGSGQPSASTLPKSHKLDVFNSNHDPRKEHHPSIKIPCL